MARPNICIFVRLFSRNDFLFSIDRGANANGIDDVFLANVNDDGEIFGHASAIEMSDAANDLNRKTISAEGKNWRKRFT